MWERERECMVRSSRRLYDYTGWVLIHNAILYTNKLQSANLTVCVNSLDIIFFINMDYVVNRFTVKMSTNLNTATNKTSHERNVRFLLHDIKKNPWNIHRSGNLSEKYFVILICEIISHLKKLPLSCFHAKYYLSHSCGPVKSLVRFFMMKRTNCQIKESRAVYDVILRCDYKKGLQKTDVKKKKETN